MNTRTFHMNGMRWAIAVIAVVAMTGTAGGAFAKERSSNSKSKTESPGSEGGNGYLGVSLQELTDDVRKGLDLDVSKGVLVSGVEDDAPAEVAGIEEGDVITAFNGKSVTSPSDLRAEVRKVEPGKTARVDVIRDGKKQTITVTVGERPEHDSFIWRSDGQPMRFGREFSMMGGRRLGIEAHELEDDGLASYFGAKKGEGVLVLSVDEESVAGKAGVKAGDIISRVGDETIDDVSDVRTALRDYDEGDQFDITVMRHGKSQSLKATMDDQTHEFAFTVPGPETFHWRGPRQAPHAYRELLRENRQDLRRELDDLKKELRELKEELQERNDG